MTALPLIGPVEKAVKHIVDAVAGFGELQPLLEDASIEELWINGPSEVFVAREGRSELTSITLTESRIRDLVERMLKSSGRRLDLSMPAI
ncbi:Flp pilus assembly CpaF family ATPase [Nesterenkonia lutea]|uniref:Flp pilus assembly CpaF family ATPase n=1 Tax=Nesterenkonia lutea TaxID=272919 RepID=A0ABR9JEE6_9MICC|nr:Flp pilus assembly CpaF family ATPase [Nesterenkonia lutea]